MGDRAPKFDVGPAVTCHANVALTGGRFCAVVGASVDGNVRVGKPALKGKVKGVLARDAAAGDKVGVYGGKGLVIRVDNTNAAITAGDDLEVDAEGMVRTWTNGVVVAVAEDDAAASTTCLLRTV
jgi:hypothetical protein